jgi:hypothetical protein
MQASINLSCTLRCHHGQYEHLITRGLYHDARRQRDACSTGTAAKTADIPSDLLATLKSDLKEDLAETKSCLEREGLTWNEGLDAEPLDLDRTRHALLVQGIGRCLAGNANSPVFLYISAGNGWRRLFYNIGQSLQICTKAYPPCPAVKGPKRKSAIKPGWPDLAIWRHGSAWEGDQLVYRFDGNIYKMVCCTHVQHRNPNVQSGSQPRYSSCLPGSTASER